MFATIPFSFGGISSNDGGHSYMCEWVVDPISHNNTQYIVSIRIFGNECVKKENGVYNTSTMLINTNII